MISIFQRLFKNKNTEDSSPKISQPENFENHTPTLEKVQQIAVSKWQEQDLAKWVDEVIEAYPSARSLEERTVVSRESMTKEALLSRESSKNIFSEEEQTPLTEEGSPPVCGAPPRRTFFSSFGGAPFPYEGLPQTQSSVSFGRTPLNYSIANPTPEQKLSPAELLVLMKP
jgi:hypothetical protein